MPEYVSEIEQAHFDEQTLELYWRFLAERQAVWVRRTRGMEPPWTGDPILQVEFITNVYRVLDPGTRYLIDNILATDGEPDDESTVFNIMLYRLMGSVPETHRHLGLLAPRTFDPEAVVARLRELPQEHRIFGDAYRVASYHDEGGADKAENVARMFAYLAGGMAETTRRIKSSRRVIEVYKVFEDLKGFGDFLSHQATVDLLYPNATGYKIVPFTDDEFAKAGPGARKGIWTLIREDVKPANMTLPMEWLRDHQQDEFDRLGIRFPYLESADGEPQLMSVCDVQASLCEFYKYHRLWSGEKSVQTRRWDGPHRDVLAYNVHMTEEELSVLLSGLIEPFTFQREVGDAEEFGERIVDDDGSPGRDVWDSEGQGSDGPEPGPDAPTSRSLDLEVPAGQPLALHLTININIGR